MRGFAHVAYPSPTLPAQKPENRPLRLSTMSLVLDAAQLSRIFGTGERAFTAVDRVSLRISSGEIHALGDTCTHGDISLAEGFVEDDTLECWAHGSKFELTTGKPLTLPAYEPVPVFGVEVRDGDVWIDPTPRPVS